MDTRRALRKGAGLRVPRKPLSGPRKVRVVHGRAFDDIQSDAAPQFITVELSASAMERRDHYNDPANKPHVGDLGGRDLNRVIGMPMRDTHGKVDIGRVVDAEMRGKELWITGELYGDIDEGYEAICDFDNGELGALSLKWQTHYDPSTKMVLSKDLLEISVCKVPHFPSCVVTAAASGTTASISDSTLKTQANPIETVVRTQSFIIMQASEDQTNSAAQQQNLTPPTSTGGTQEQQPPSMASQLQDPASVIQSMTKSLQGQRTENAQLKDQLQQAMAQLKAITDRQNQELEARKKAALEHAPQQLEELKRHSGVEQLHKDTVALFGKILQEPVVNKNSQLGTMVTACAAKATKLEAELAAMKKKVAATERAGGMARLEMAAAAAGEAMGLMTAPEHAVRTFNTTPASDAHYGDTLQAGDVPNEFLMGDWNTGMSHNTDSLAQALRQRGTGFAEPPIRSHNVTPTQQYSFHHQQQPQAPATMQMAASGGAVGFSDEPLDDAETQRRIYQQRLAAEQQRMQSSMDSFLQRAATSGAEAKGLVTVTSHRDGFMDDIAGAQQQGASIGRPQVRRIQA